MAENQWGPKPFVKPPPSVFPAPAFWGPAEVPDQVRGQPRVDTWVNKDYSWEPPAVQSVEAGPHDSWVAPIIDQSFLSEPGEGSQGTEGNFRAGHRAQEGGDHDSYVSPIIDQEFPSEAGEGSQDTEGNSRAGHRAQEGGDHETFVAPVLDQEFPSEAGEGSQDTEGNFRAGHRAQEGGDHDSYVSPIIDQEFPSEAGEGSRYGGDHDSYVAPVLKQFFPSEAGEGSQDTEGTFMANHRPQEATSANPLNPFIRIQAAGDAETWVAPVIKQHFLSSAGEGERYGGENDSWIDPVIKQYFPSLAGDNFVPGTQESFLSTANDDFVPGIQGSFLSTGYSGTTGESDADGFTDEKLKYMGSWNFEAEIDRISENINFLSISGVSSESEPIEFKFGTDPFKRSLPGVAKFGEVEMTRYHKAGSKDLWQWRQNIEDGFIDIRNITLRLKHLDNETVAFSMTLHNCWPMKWDAPDMNAGGTEGAIEKITFKVARVTKEVGDPGLLGQIAGFIGSLIG